MTMLTSGCDQVVVTDVTATLFRWPGIPPVSYGGRNREMPESELALVRVETDAGIVGEAFLGSSVRSARLDLDGLFRTVRPELIGAPALSVEATWSRLQRCARAATQRVIGTVDVALWDIVGKAAGMPLRKIFGGARQRLPAYASSPTYDAVAPFVEEAKEMRAQGFRGYKIHPPADVAMCIEICRTLRAELGDDYPLMLDASSLFDVYDGMKIATAVDELRLEWIEDPIAENDIYNYAKLRNCTKTPLMATEYSGGEFAGFAPWLVAGATDYLRGDVLVKGGATGLLKAAHLAEGFGLNLEIHHGGNSFANIAQLHLACGISNSAWFEVLLPHGAQKFGVVNDIELDPEGYVAPPERPGCGVEIDMAVVEAGFVERFG